MSNYPIFSVLGIEIEYMLVDNKDLQIQPKSDVILKALAGHQVDEVDLGDIAISNELVMHVLEFKNNGPKSRTAPVAQHFQKTIQDLQPLLEELGLLLLPTGAHPWMDPHTETVRWPHGHHDIYQQFDAIFDCKGHGWSNLQSMHVNLPYANEEEFCQLHNLIRLIVPLLPSLAASTPFLDGKPTGLLDSRLHFYNCNQQKIPSISGHIVPEFIRTESEYQHTILNPMYQDIKPFDPKGILQHSWLNSRAAIPKFNYKAIEIRVLDTQECTEADIAIAHAITAILQHWQQSSQYYLENPCEINRLKPIYHSSIKTGFDTLVEDKELLKQWQLPLTPMNLQQIWSKLIEIISSKLTQKQQTVLEFIIKEGNLSQRLLKSFQKQAEKQTLKDIYRQLAFCLISNQQYRPS